MYVCLHECLHSFLYAAYRRIHLRHGEGEDLRSKEVSNHDLFFFFLK